MIASYFGQGYPMVAERAGRRYAVAGWETGPMGHALPLLVPIDAPGGQPSTSERAHVEGGEFAFSILEPARELAAEVNAVLDRFEDEGYYGGPGDQSPDLVHTLRALLASWST